MKFMTIALLTIIMGLIFAYFTLQIQSENEQSSQIVNLEQTESPRATTNNPLANLIKPKTAQQNQTTIIVDQARNLDDLPNDDAFEPEQIWQLATVVDQLRPKSLPDNVNVEYIKIADPKNLAFSEGQKLSLLIPQENKFYVGTIEESTSEFDGTVVISSGDIKNGGLFSSFSIVEGENTTFVTVATGESIYQIEIDQKSGIGIVMDDRELDQYRHDDDGILPPLDGL
jgi:hypothetical protein